MIEISVIIPSNHDHHALCKVVRAVCDQLVRPAEIVIIDSSVERGTCPAEITALCGRCGIKLIYEHRKLALPGGARNIGLDMVNSEFIAFIDIQTIPRPNWLKACEELLTTHGIVGVWGATFFSAETKFEGLVRDGFYGVQPRRTLPGSVFRRETFEKTGQFIDWIRAGEDTEWMLRLDVLKITVAYSSSALVDYVGLIGADIKQLLTKWYRNYTVARELPHFFPQKLLLWLILYPFIVLIAFNWNYLIADWRTDSPFYIGHVTKIVAILPGVTYVIVRGLILPLQRGVGILRLLPIRFAAIAFVCFMADFVKVLVLSLPQRKRDADTPDFGI